MSLTSVVEICHPCLCALDLVSVTKVMDKFRCYFTRSSRLRFFEKVEKYTEFWQHNIQQEALCSIEPLKYCHFS